MRPRRIQLPKGSPVIVCLCGSTRFVEQFNRYRQKFTLDGEIVLSIEIVTTQTRDEDPQHADPAAKGRLDALHFRKIELADRVFVINPGGYVGESTAREIVHAERLGKPVEYLDTIKTQSFLEDEEAIEPMLDHESANRLFVARGS